MGVQRWEIAGVSLWPVIEAALALDLHTAAGLTEAQLLKVAIAGLTIAALVRATLAARRPTVLAAALAPPPAVRPHAGELPADFAPHVIPGADSTTRRIEGLDG